MKHAAGRRDMRALVVGPALTLCLAGPAAAQTSERLTGGNGTLYVSAQPGRMLVIDEATEKVVDEITIRQGIWESTILSADRTRFYVRDSTFEYFEIVDVATRERIDSFTLSEGNRKVRIRGFQVDPEHQYAVFMVQAATKLPDRFEVEPRKLLQYDLETHEIIREIPWPDGRERTGLNMLFSPDGSLVYFFANDVIALETENFTEVERWELSRPIQGGMGRLNYEFTRDVINEEPGFFTGLFRVRDPVQNRRLLGVARIDLANRDVDFYTLGPAVSMSFALAPGRTKGYGLLDEIGHYEFWTFDLVNRKVANRAAFGGRPRMALTVSSNGQILYIYQAGNTIDLYEAATYRYLRTITLDGDMTSDVFVVPPDR